MGFMVKLLLRIIRNSSSVSAGAGTGSAAGAASAGTSRKLLYFRFISLVLYLCTCRSIFSMTRSMDEYISFVDSWARNRMPLAGTVISAIWLPFSTLRTAVISPTALNCLVTLSIFFSTYAFTAGDTTVFLPLTIMAILSPPWTSKVLLGYYRLRIRKPRPFCYRSVKPPLCDSCPLGFVPVVRCIFIRHAAFYSCMQRKISNFCHFFIQNCKFRYNSAGRFK